MNLLHNNKKIILLILISLSALWGQKGLTSVRDSVISGGNHRTYYLSLPENWKNKPLVFNLHGLGSTALEQKLYTQFDAVAQSNNFAVVYPDAQNRTWALFGTKDSDFLLLLLDTLLSRYKFDSTRVYFTGFSMGGFMSHNMACLASHRIAAIASVAGLNLSTSCNPARPISVLQIHGDADGTVSYSGTTATINVWLQKNRCDTTGIISQPWPIEKQNSSILLKHYPACAENTEVKFFTLRGLGHVWPGGLGTSTELVAQDQIWKFFEGHQRPVNLVPPKRTTSPEVFKQFFRINKGTVEIVFIPENFNLFITNIAGQKIQVSQKTKFSLPPGLYIAILQPTVLGQKIQTFKFHLP